MEKMSELAISDVKKLTEGKKVKVQMASAMSLQMTEAIVIADPDFGNDGKISILMPDTGCKIELDSAVLKGKFCYSLPEHLKFSDLKFSV